MNFSTYAAQIDRLEKSFYLFNLKEIISESLRLFKPKHFKPIINWAEKNIILDETAPAYIQGPFSIEKMPHLKEILEVASHPAVRYWDIMGCAQFGKTLLLQILWAYFVDQDPSNMLIYHPGTAEAKSFSEEKLQRLIEASHLLRKKIAPQKRGNSKESSTFKKRYLGGTTEIGSISAKGRTRQRSARRAYGDDCDGVDIKQKTREGNPFANLEKRTASFKYDFQVGNISTPRIEGESFIYTRYIMGSMGEFYITCPHCNTEQRLSDERIVCDTDKDLMGGVTKYHYKTAKVACEGCGVLFDEKDRITLLRKGFWKHKYPHLLYYHPTWQLPEISSTISSLEKVAEQKYEAQKASALGDDSLLESFYNNCKGIPYRKERGKETDAKILLDRREDYIDKKNHLIPNGVLVITAMVDVQAGGGDKPSRLELECWGWGMGEEGWIIDKQVFEGNVLNLNGAWANLEKYWNGKIYKRVDGVELDIARRFIDSGYKAQTVYDFCAGRAREGIIAIKGANRYSAPIIPRNTTLVNNEQTVLIHIGTQEAKAELFGRMNTINSPGPKYIHFTKTYCGLEYFEQITAEHAVRKTVAGIPFDVYEKKQKNLSNEATDLIVGAFAAMKSLPINWERLQANINRQTEKQQEDKRPVKKKRRTFSIRRAS